MWAHRRILRTSWTEHRSNTLILENLNANMMLRAQIMVKRKLAFFGDAMRCYGLEKLLIREKPQEGEGEDHLDTSFRTLTYGPGRTLPQK